VTLVHSAAPLADLQMVLDGTRLEFRCLAALSEGSMGATELRIAWRERRGVPFCVRATCGQAVREAYVTLWPVAGEDHDWSPHYICALEPTINSKPDENKPRIELCYVRDQNTHKLRSCNLIVPVRL
jgi:hypothetical protein